MNKEIQYRIESLVSACNQGLSRLGLDSLPYFTCELTDVELTYKRILQLLDHITRQKKQRDNLALQNSQMMNEKSLLKIQFNSLKSQNINLNKKNQNIELRMNKQIEQYLIREQKYMNQETELKSKLKGLETKYKMLEKTHSKLIIDYEKMKMEMVNRKKQDRKPIINKNMNERAVNEKPNPEILRFLKQTRDHQNQNFRNILIQENQYLKQWLNDIFKYFTQILDQRDKIVHEFQNKNKTEFEKRDNQIQLNLCIQTLSKGIPFRKLLNEMKDMVKQAYHVMVRERIKSSSNIEQNKAKISMIKIINRYKRLTEQFIAEYYLFAEKKEQLSIAYQSYFPKMIKYEDVQSEETVRRLSKAANHKRVGLKLVNEKIFNLIEKYEEKQKSKGVNRKNVAIQEILRRQKLVEALVKGDKEEHQGQDNNPINDVQREQPQQQKDIQI